jgi:serralysin
MQPRRNPTVKKLVSLLVGASLALAAVIASPAGAGTQPTIAEVAAGSSDFEMLVAALDAAGLVGAVADPDASLTVFAPTDAAFVALARDLGYPGTDEAGALGFLVGALGIDTIRNVLLYHVAAGEYDARSLIRARSVTPLFDAAGPIGVQGVNLRDAARGLRDPQFRVNGQINTANGIIHPINRVLVPLNV